ncbi:hypothetical protein LZ017_09275 [Pelomonas sp. CA6]|uniref:hypothetical protein n=1 Tax=Pelomonas sp. CA6 TaxID=2907999 RepID=UPI001F4C2189|nr:hypothetical protein [Pelomonas sp. CA6]MCH7343570.1 hypothetical protein [Pelomonas sp. CA6]
MATPNLPELWQLGVEREYALSGLNENILTFIRGNGQLSSYMRGASNRLQPISVAMPDPAWSTNDSGHIFYRDLKSNLVEEYDNTTRKVMHIARSDGKRISYSRAISASSDYPAGAILHVEDQDGRRIAMRYQAGKLVGVTDPGGASVSIDLSPLGVSRLRWPDGTSQQFLYEGSDGRLLTGKVDEAGVRVGTYRYDEVGRAIGTQRASGNDEFSVRWSKPPFWAYREYFDATHGVIWQDHFLVQGGDALVSLPNGATETVKVAEIGGAVKWREKVQTGADGKARRTTRSFDEHLNVTELVDYNGNRTCMNYESARNVESSRIEGLTALDTCAAAAMALPAGARKISSQWHPDWNFQTRIAEPGRITTLVYNGQPNPLNGNAVASCAPAGAYLPDNKPIAVLCMRAEQATTDTNGAQGFGATVQSGVPIRIRRWTYDAAGRVLTETDPRGQVVMTHEYYATSTAGYTRGDLKSMTNALGHMTRFPRYNVYGQPLEMVDANNVITTYAYDARQRLISSTTHGAVTSYEYWPTGLLKRTVQPDNTAISYEYDDAHRLVAVSDSQANRIEYTLDASGNRIKEEARDPTGMLKRILTRTFDALGRAQQVTGRE